jgi:hypothetical protein
MSEKYHIQPACYDCWQRPGGTPQVDLGVLLRYMRLANRLGGAGAPGGAAAARQTADPKELLPIMPYLIQFHFKFWEMLDDFTIRFVPC